MPECWYFSNFGECGNKECIFLHIRPEEKATGCCRRALCPASVRVASGAVHRHAPLKKPCPNCLGGFCPGDLESVPQDIPSGVRSRPS